MLFRKNPSTKARGLFLYRDDSWGVCDVHSDVHDRCDSVDCNKPLREFEGTSLRDDRSSPSDDDGDPKGLRNDLYQRQ